ncbi:fasciclin domain-containing protein [Akkermansiaceae bacterium]|nr:fasciclin domain-containing protein [Verrucomicrobiota bacterium]MDA7607215.1 fasciclin domain-containing protein [Akkermansiaceae bacterium]MDA7663494.1 fasciclin domain-containing protein [Akkermansiaceae bacterium]MDB4658804.1 fasciclin domain-containing protein [bacterium]MDC0568226.1 fasciclin domain-containing protein [Akkermansiaceae bacterium]
MKKLLLSVTALLISGSLLIGAPKNDIIETTMEAGSFKTLISAVKTADLVDTLKGEGPFTVFAPTDEAFKKFWPETLKNLLKPENKDKLQMLLTYHVISGKVKAKKAKKLEIAVPVSGGSLKFSAKNKELYVNYAKVVKPDIKASNGIIHVIDAVLIPNTMKDSK